MHCLSFLAWFVQVMDVKTTWVWMGGCGCSDDHLGPAVLSWCFGSEAPHPMELDIFHEENSSVVPFTSGVNPPNPPPIPPQL